MMEPTNAPATATGQGPGGGGYGPPPGGGGYGPPPGGGGYDPPPGGGYGPPAGGPPPWGGGGYGPPPGGAYGAPPPMPPRKSGPNLGLILGLGCLGLFVLGGIGAGVALFVVGRGRPSYVAPISTPTPPRPIVGGGGLTTPTAPAGSLRAEIRDLRDFKGDFGKVRHFVGELYNTGEEPLGFPNAKVTLYDASKTAIDSGTCASLIRVLPPGAKVPCFFSTFKADTYTTYKTEITPMKAYYKGELPELSIADVKFTPKRGYSPNQLDGKITNKSNFKAKSVWALVSLYGADGKIVGADQALIAGTDLDPASSALFSSKIHNVAAPPQTYNVTAIGYSD